VVPTNTPTLEATEGFPPVGFTFQRRNDALRSGDDWVETVDIYPFGGDGQYVVFHEGIQIPGPPYFIEIRARGNRQGNGCSPAFPSVRVGSAAMSFQDALFFEPPPDCNSWWP
jgi:hypothetical protein